MLIGFAGHFNIDVMLFDPFFNIEKKDGDIRILLKNDSLIFHQYKDVVFYFQLEHNELSTGNHEKNNFVIKDNDCIEGKISYDQKQHLVMVSFDRISYGLECVFTIDIDHDISISNADIKEENKNSTPMFVKNTIISMDDRRLVIESQNGSKKDFESDTQWFLVSVILVLILTIISIKWLYDVIYFGMLLLLFSKNYEHHSLHKNLVKKLKTNYDISISNIDATIILTVYDKKVTTISKISKDISLNKRYTYNRIMKLVDFRLLKYDGFFLTVPDPVKTVLE